MPWVTLSSSGGVRACGPERDLPPCANPSIAGVEQTSDRHRRVDQADVRVDERKVSEQLACLGVDILGEQPVRIRVADDAIEDRARVLEPAREREGFGPPERTPREHA